MAKGAKVLIYNIDAAAPKGTKLRNALRISGADCRSLTVADSSQVLGYLLGLDGFAENPPPREPSGGEALIFYNFTRQGLDRLLAALKRAGIRIPLKAVVTEHNVQWTVAKLLGELEQEHLLMQSWQRLSTCVKQYKGKDRELMKAAKELLSSHAPDARELEEMLERFENRD